ncbi:MAG TPA: fluoride efflux transporter CrcB [Armatimonadota bacterium]|jgi:CrcB protein
MLFLKRMLVVGAGGFIGANARYWLGGWVQQRFGPAFPYGTFVINVTGCFILGLFATLALSLALRDEWRLFVAIGFVGAYTTFSTFEYETLRMVAEGARWREAMLNIAASVAFGFAAAWLGVVAARLLLRGRA